MDFFLSVELFWYWLALGCMFMVLELVLGSGFLLVVGSAALVTSAISFLWPGLSWLWSSFLCAVLMAPAAWLWWHFVVQRRKNKKVQASALNARGQEMTGRQMILEQALKNGSGRVHLGDASWPVRAESDLPAGTRVEISGVEGITLLVRQVAPNDVLSPEPETPYSSNAAPPAP